MRTTINLAENQVSALSELCKKEHISRAEAIRRAIWRLLDDIHHESIDEAFGIWKNKRINSRKHIEIMRAEWEKK